MLSVHPARSKSTRGCASVCATGTVVAQSGSAGVFGQATYVDQMLSDTAKSSRSSSGSDSQDVSAHRTHKHRHTAISRVAVLTIVAINVSLVGASSTDIPSCNDLVERLAEHVSSLANSCDGVRRPRHRT